MFNALLSLFGAGRTASWLGAILFKGSKLIREWKKDGQLSKEEMQLVADLVLDTAAEATVIPKADASFWAEWIVSGLDKARKYFN